ncbi:hypothetical protein OG930_32890 [Streptomyces sp. NBC_01799]|uniref:hypothetical protein n=1 Tax=Streptomyces sp. NBC_01800 TaxID=2975945 RepID=UPI002DDC82CE|nr:hypothetical protein [Streptomyces sp. NBC_01800]WSA71492.1 hypothetical protein OIE65_33505 [Streptomyces sp. NBC_01800]WSA80003.1 hypothetical protein OG930_32890 [Streptomyces sp. NBC_01799]
MSAGVVVGFGCGDRAATPMVRHRTGASGDRGRAWGVQELERITAYRGELDSFADELAKTL